MISLEVGMNVLAPGGAVQVVNEGTRPSRTCTSGSAGTRRRPPGLRPASWPSSSFTGWRRKDLTFRSQQAGNALTGFDVSDFDPPDYMPRRQLVVRVKPSSFERGAGRRRQALGAGPPLPGAAPGSNGRSAGVDRGKRDVAGNSRADAARLDSVYGDAGPQSVAVGVGRRAGSPGSLRNVRDVNGEIACPLLVVGLVALDSVETPARSRGRWCSAAGGTFFSYAASYFTPVRLVGVVGEDFPLCAPRDARRPPGRHPPA